MNPEKKRDFNFKYAFKIKFKKGLNFKQLYSHYLKNKDEKK